MILATVGTQLPFDRMLSALDAWASRHPGMPVTAQTGVSGEDFHHMSCARFMAPHAFSRAMTKARLIVSHAGMGSILTAAEMGKPIIIMPRRADLGEHRTDHQMHTAQEMQRLPNVSVVENAAQLAIQIERILMAEADASSVIAPAASPALLGAVSGFIHGRAA